MKASIGGLLVLVVTLWAIAPASAVDDGGGVPDASADGDSFEVGVDEKENGSEGNDSPANSSGGGPVTTYLNCDQGGGCTSTLICQEGSTLYEVWLTQPGGQPEFDRAECLDDSELETPLITPAVALSAFRRIPLPESVLQVQPPGGETLVNFATNFMTEAEPFERTVTLLGQQVRLKIKPDSYEWWFGDGSSEAGTDPGALYPDLRVTHDYQQADYYQPNVDTVWSATFSVNGGPWQPVIGTVTIDGEPVQLLAITATPRLTSYG